MVALPIKRWTEAEYLEIDRTSEMKHEFVQGEIYAMAGASRWHLLVVGNLSASIRPQLRGKNCQHYTTDARVKIPSRNYLYPDLVIVCGTPHFETIEGVDTLFNPTVIIEVLSPSTRVYDETVKWRLYRSIPSLQEYVLVDSRSMWVEHSVLDGAEWKLKDISEGKFYLASVGCELALSDIYEDVAFE